MSFSNFSMNNLAGNSILPRSNPGGSPGPAILAFMGMAGGAYYLYKQKGTNNPQRVPNSNPNSVAKGEPDHPRLQDYLKFHPMAGVQRKTGRTEGTLM